MQYRKKGETQNEPSERTDYKPRGRGRGSYQNYRGGYKGNQNMVYQPKVAKQEDDEKGQSFGADQVQMKYQPKEKSDQKDTSLNESSQWRPKQQKESQQYRENEYDRDNYREDQYQPKQQNQYQPKQQDQYQPKQSYSYKQKNQYSRNDQYDYEQNNYDRGHDDHQRGGIREPNDPLPKQFGKTARDADHSKYKTEPCKYWEESGECKFGDGCSFYHSDQRGGKVKDDYYNDRTYKEKNYGDNYDQTYDKDYDRAAGPAYKFRGGTRGRGRGDRGRGRGNRGGYNQSEYRTQDNSKSQYGDNQYKPNQYQQKQEDNYQNTADEQYQPNQQQHSTEAQHQQQVDTAHKAYMPRFSTKLYGQAQTPDQIDGGGQDYQMTENNLDSLPFYGNSDRYQSQPSNSHQSNQDGGRWNEGSYRDKDHDYGQEDYGESYGGKQADYTYQAKYDDDEDYLDDPEDDGQGYGGKHRADNDTRDKSPEADHTGKRFNTQYVARARDDDSDRGRYGRTRGIEGRDRGGRGTRGRGRGDTRGRGRGDDRDFRGRGRGNYKTHADQYDRDEYQEDVDQQHETPRGRGRGRGGHLRGNDRGGRGNNADHQRKQKEQRWAEHTAWREAQNTKPDNEPYFKFEGKAGENQDGNQDDGSQRSAGDNSGTGQKFDDFGDEEFKWDENADYQEDDVAQDDSSYSGSTTTASSGNQPGGNNQISRKYFAMGPTTDHVKTPCKVMMVAEKPSIARSITEALCGRNFSQRTGPAKGIPIYTFKGHFKGRTANFKVSSVAGHVYNRDFPADYQDRRKDPVSLFDAPTIRACDKRARPVAKHLQMLSSDCDFIVLWLDCDREGENICYEVLEICKKNIPRSSVKVQRVYRAKFSSIANKDIVAAFEGLKHEPNYNESISVDARQVLDLKIGVAFSRFQTSALAGPMKKAGIGMLTYGPCQTPTLGFCVDQAEKIKKFVPETFWRVEAQVVDEKGGLHRMKWCRGKIFDKTVVSAIHQRLQRHYGAREAEVLSVHETPMTQTRPQGLNTVKLLKVGSQSFGCGARETLQIAERLYLRGFTTYPRTESTTFSNNFNFKEVLSSLKEHHEYGEYAGDLLKNGYEKPRKGVDAGDHPPITPVRAAKPGELGDRERQVYEYITCTFLACISKDARYSGIRTELLIGGEEKFKIKGQVLQDSGFLDIMPWQRHADKEIPVYQVGDIIDVKSTSIVEGRTAPPGFLTEADLIAQMEKHGIGTDASIPTHISNIIERNYVTVTDGARHLVPTLLGQALVKGYCEIDPELVLPQVRSNIEKSCELLAQGRADFNKVVGHVLSIFKDKFNHFKLSVGTMERIINIMLNTRAAETLSLSLTSKILVKEASKDSRLNFCCKCFKGHLCLQYHNKKGWGLKCDQCNFRITVLQGAARVKRIDDEEKKCDECGSYTINVVYKENSPFPPPQTSHTGCLLCDAWLKATIHNFFSTQNDRLMTRADAEAAQQRKDERKKEQAEKKLQKSLEEKPTEATAAPNKKKKKTKQQGLHAGDQLTAEEKMNEFMKSLHN